MENGDFGVENELRKSLHISDSTEVDKDSKVVAEDCAFDGPDDLTCAICLGQIPVSDIATVKGCDHCYCVNCILEWTTHKEAPWCPQCKQPFNYLYCYRRLDGSLTDYPAEESVVLLKRAHWFQDFIKEQEQRRCKASPLEERPPSAAGRARGDWVSEFYEDFEDADDSDELEDYYFSSAAGTARVVLGNRRLGENGYMRAGRMYARPVPTAATAKSSKNPRKARHTDVVSGSPASSGSSPPSQMRAPLPSQGPTPGPSAAQGRRAKRNAKRAVVDQEA